jgi:hypothetical protein
MDSASGICMRTLAPLSINESILYYSTSAWIQQYVATKLLFDGRTVIPKVLRSSIH